MTMAAAIPAPTATAADTSIAAAVAASVTAAAMEPTEAYRVAQVASANTAAATAAAVGVRTANTPPAVATPFPPRKPSHTGYTWPMIDASPPATGVAGSAENRCATSTATAPFATSDRKSTRPNSSHGYISYAVFCLKKKKKIVNIDTKITITTK